jgi:hypothetical protein
MTEKFKRMKIPDLGKKKRPKYGNRKVLYRGELFDSTLERDHFIFLEREQSAGRITDLERQAEYPLDVNGQHICSIRLDYRYRKGGTLVVSDAKGIATPDWRIKAKLFTALYDMPIHVVTKANLTRLP